MSKKKKQKIQKKTVQSHNFQNSLKDKLSGLQLSTLEQPLPEKENVEKSQKMVIVHARKEEGKSDQELFAQAFEEVSERTQDILKKYDPNDISKDPEDLEEKIDSEVAEEKDANAYSLSAGDNRLFLDMLDNFKEN